MKNVFYFNEIDTTCTFVEFFYDIFVEPLNIYIYGLKMKICFKTASWNYKCYLEG